MQRSQCSFRRVNFCVSAWASTRYGEDILSSNVELMIDPRNGRRTHCITRGIIAHEVAHFFHQCLHIDDDLHKFAMVSKFLHALDRLDNQGHVFD
jgi:hypothetical protein